MEKKALVLISKVDARYWVQVNKDGLPGHLLAGKPSWCRTSQPSRQSLAIPPWVVPALTRVHGVIVLAGAWLRAS